MSKSSSVDTILRQYKTETEVKNIEKKKDLLEKTLVISKEQTKKYRIQYIKNIKSNTCELYQKNQIYAIMDIKNITKKHNIELKNTNERINKITLEIEKTRKIIDKEYGFFLTEDFDGKIENYNGFNIYFNLKYCVGSGGSQNRTLKLTYSFIFEQFKLLKKKKCNIKFINIIDGDNFYYFTLQFNFLKKLCSEFKKQIFIGNMYDFYYSSFLHEL